MTEDGAAPPRTLSEHHRDELLRKGAIRPEIAAAAGVYTVTTADELPGQLRGGPAEKGTPGVAFPWRPVSEDGDMFWQFRPDKMIPLGNPEDPDTEWIKYVFPAGIKLCLNTHPFMRARVHDPKAPLVIIEGTKQYLAAVSALEVEGKFAAVGISGCWGWSTGGGNPIPDLSAIPWRDDAGNPRPVYLCFDADVTTNRDVWSAADRLIGWLKGAGVQKPRIINIPGGDKHGLDDVLAEWPNAADFMANLVEGALDKLPRRPAKSKAGPYFDQEGGLLTLTAANALLEEYPAALALDGYIAVYSNGVYVAHKDALDSAIADMLGENYRTGHAANIYNMVRSVLMMTGRRLTDRPSTNLLNVANGMLDPLTGELHPHDPKYLSSAQIPVRWDPEATCPTYERWLESVCPIQAAALEEAAALMLNPARIPHKSLFLFGVSHSGKSTFLRIMKAIAGDANTSGVTLHQLADDKFSAAQVYGKLLNVGADLSNASVEDLSTFKMLTGEDLIEANRKYGQKFSFTNRALFAFSANDVPMVSEISRAYFNRILPFKFPHTFAGNEDPTIEATILETELSGVLKRWQFRLVETATRGHMLPTDPAVAVEFEINSDKIQLWISEDMRIVAPVAVSDFKTATPASKGMTASRIYDRFVAWCTDNNVGLIGKQKFYRRLTSVDGVNEVRIGEAKTRGYNLIVKPEEVVAEHTPETITEDPDGRSGNFKKDSTRAGEGSKGTLNPYRGVVVKTATSATEGPARISVGYLTEAVYAAIARDPGKVSAKAIMEELGLSLTDWHAERDYLESRGVIRSLRPKRGFEILRELIPTPVEYVPLADPSWCYDADGEGPWIDWDVTRPCAVCGGEDDRASYYFPLCSSHRSEVPS